MKLYTLTKQQFVGNTTVTNVIASGITRVMAQNLIAKSPKTIADTTYNITQIN